MFAIFIWRACTYKTNEKYILPNGYKGFFGVIYQANPNFEKLEDVNYRLYKISSQGVYESGYRLVKGTLHQEFYFKNGEEINSFGFQMLGRLDLKTNENELKAIRNGKNKLFAIWVYGAFINGGENSVAIYFIGTGTEFLELLSKTEKIYKSMSKYDRNLQEENNSLKNYIQRLNQEYKARKPPFD